MERRGRAEHVRAVDGHAQACGMLGATLREYIRHPGTARCQACPLRALPVVWERLCEARVWHRRSAPLHQVGAILAVFARTVHGEVIAGDAKACAPDDAPVAKAVA